MVLAQVDSRLGELDANLETAGRIIRETRSGEPDLVLFPELSVSGYSVGLASNDVGMRSDDQRLISLAQMASSTGLLLGLAERVPGEASLYNSAAYYQDGELLHVQRKLHLPDYGVFDEAQHFRAGPSLRAFSTSHGRMATLVCNDAWHPHLAFLAVHDGAQVLLMPTSSAKSMTPTYDARSYWRDITRFTARIFQTYVVFINRVGTEGHLRFWGGSHIVDPRGEVVAEAPEDEEHVLTAEIDIAAVDAQRRDLPLLKEARLDLLQRELARLSGDGG